MTCHSGAHAQPAVEFGAWGPLCSPCIDRLLGAEHALGVAARKWATLASMASNDNGDVDAELAAALVRDVELRLELLRKASRAGEPLTADGRPTAQGHILSAITQLERKRDELYRGK